MVTVTAISTTIITIRTTPPPFRLPSISPFPMVS